MKIIPAVATDSGDQAEICAPRPLSDRTRSRFRTAATQPERALDQCRAGRGRVCREAGV